MRVVSNKAFRWIVIDEVTEKVLDDAQGYGYRSKGNAYRAFFYKNPDEEVKYQKKISKTFWEENPELKEKVLDYMKSSTITTSYLYWSRRTNGGNTSKINEDIQE